MRLVADLNFFVSAILWSGPPNQLLRELDERRIKIAASWSMIDHLHGVLKRKKLAKHLALSGRTADEHIGELIDRLLVVEPGPILAICRDPDDDIVLATALAAAADMIVTGDDDLLCLSIYEGISILTPAQALDRINPPPE